VTLQLLQRQVHASSPGVEETMRDLAAEIARVEQRIKGVVKFAQLVTKQREPRPGYHPVDQMVDWAVEPVAALAKSRGIDFGVHVPSDLPEVHVDAELVGEAFFQMAHNAVKFNHPGGEAEMRAYRSDGMVHIEVSDTGIGLTAERLALLGRPFEQGADALRRGQEGLGLGWAFVCYVAEVHDGRTDVRSPGREQGSTFSLSLPLPSEPGQGADFG
jgi:signal transduction histidine kinase